MKVIFLDVDGVLNYEGGESKLPQGTYFVEDDKLKLLRELVKDTDAELVLSSSWRSGWSTFATDSSPRVDFEDSRPYFMLCAKLLDYGLNLLSEIPRLPNCSRETAIDKWIEQWPGKKIDEYVILDDEEKSFSKTNAHVILVSPKNGLMPEDIEMAKKILKCTKKKLLIVDDIDVNRVVVRVSLENKYEVVEAANGREALKIIKDNPDLAAVITDIQMPIMDGLELIKAIRSEKQYDDLIIIANTQYGDSKQEEDILELGANEFIYKPTRPTIIRHRVDNSLRLRDR